MTDLDTAGIKAALADIVAEQAMVDSSEISDTTSMDDLGLDSLALVEVVFAIEEKFDISVPYNANDPAASEFDLSTFGKVVEEVEKLIKAKADT
ncbi:MAG: phosphopantetheine-binding protein [Pseudomonadota bacterium]